MNDDVDLSFPANGELSESDRDRVADLVDRLADTVGVEPLSLPPLSAERMDNSVIVRPDSPVFTVQQGTRYKVRAVSHSDNGVNSTGLKHAPESEK